MAFGGTNRKEQDMSMTFTAFLLDVAEIAGVVFDADASVALVGLGRASPGVGSTEEEGTGGHCPLPVLSRLEIGIIRVWVWSYKSACGPRKY